MYPTVSIVSEIPEELHQSLKSYLEIHPNWDQDRVLTAALSMFLMQNSAGTVNYRICAQVYLESLFQNQAQ
jgi:hypothetical protein